MRSKSPNIFATSGVECESFGADYLAAWKFCMPLVILLWMCYVARCLKVLGIFLLWSCSSYHFISSSSLDNCILQDPGDSVISNSHSFFIHFVLDTFFSKHAFIYFICCSSAFSCKRPWRHSCCAGRSRLTSFRRLSRFAFLLQIKLNIN